MSIYKLFQCAVVLLACDWKDVCSTKLELPLMSVSINIWLITHGKFPCLKTNKQNLNTPAYDCISCLWPANALIVSSLWNFRLLSEACTSTFQRGDFNFSILCCQRSTTRSPTFSYRPDSNVSQTCSESCQLSLS